MLAPSTTAVWNKKKSRWEEVYVDPAAPAPEVPRGRKHQVGKLMHPFTLTGMPPAFETTAAKHFSGVCWHLLTAAGLLRHCCDPRIVLSFCLSEGVWFGSLLHACILP